MSNALTEDRFKDLLSVKDIEVAATDEVTLNAKFYDYKQMASNVDPEQVKHMESFYGMIF